MEYSSFAALNSSSCEGARLAWAARDAGIHLCGRLVLATRAGSGGENALSTVVETYVAGCYCMYSRHKSLSMIRSHVNHYQTGSLLQRIVLDVDISRDDGDLCWHPM